MRLICLLSCLLGFAASASAATAPPPKAASVTVTSGPARVLIETLPERQDLNFELFIANAGPAPLTLTAIQVAAFDAQGRLLQRRRLDSNGVRPSIQTLPERAVAPGGALTVFNPFPSFASALALHRLDYELTLADADDNQVRATLQVHPQAWTGRSALRLPLRGRTINYDGHDYQAHHRRFDYSFAPLAALGFKSNFMRYGYDFVPVNAQGQMHAPGAGANADYFGFGALVLAAGDGVVVARESRRPDDRKFDQARLAVDPMVLYGNYLVLDHGHGEFSVYGHLQQDSVRPALGQRVRQGEPVARIGASGSAFFPHLHFQLQDAAGIQAEGLPSYFDHFRSWNGASAIARQRATVDTGEIVEAD